MSDPHADALRALLAEGLVELNRRSVDLPLLLARHAARVPAEVLAATYGYLALVQRLHALVIRAFVPLGAEHGTASAFMAAADELSRASQDRARRRLALRLGLRRALRGELAQALSACSGHAAPSRVAHARTAGRAIDCRLRRRRPAPKKPGRPVNPFTAPGAARPTLALEEEGRWNARPRSSRHS